jgi:adenylosuccinate lyase
MIPRYSRPQMSKIWEDENKFRLYLEVEIFAMEAMAKEGLIPESAPKAVREKGKFSVARILEIEEEVKHDIIAFLTCVSENVGEEARFLHYGLTSSDVIDTAFSKQLCEATDIILEGLGNLLDALKKRAYEHKLTPCIGRSHGIHAEPTTFGLKLAGFFAEISRQKARIENARKEIAVGAISGPVGTYSQLPPVIEEYVCKKMGLKPATITTQVVPRDIHATLFLSFAQLAASVERIAVEIRHLQRTEVREAEEFFSKGQKGSSAMPHKRNPVLTENLTGLSRVVRKLAETSLENIALWHERDISHSAVERVIAPDITITLDFMISRITRVISDLLVYPDKMKINIDITRGLVFSATLLLVLTQNGISREDAYSLVQRNAMRVWESINSSNPLHFKDEVLKDSDITAKVSKEAIESAFSYDRFLEHTEYIFSKVFSS